MVKTAGDIFKQARMKLGLTQAEVATKAGIYPNTYARLERNYQKPTYETLKKIAKVLELDINNIPG